MKKKHFIMLLSVLLIAVFGYYFYGRTSILPEYKNNVIDGEIFSTLEEVTPPIPSLGSDTPSTIGEHASKYDPPGSFPVEKTGEERKVRSERLSDEEIPISAIEELSSNEDIASKSLSAIGFSKQGIDAATSNNPKALLSLEDMPEILRDALKIELEKSKNNGYDEVKEIEADAITGIMNYIIGNDNSDPNITFSMSILPSSITRNFEYIGYTFPNYPAINDPSIKNHTIRRVFSRHDASSLLVVEESSTLSGGAVLVKEFVNATVGGQPGIYAIKKSKSGKTYAMLNWTTSNFAYTLYQIDSLDSAKEILTFIGDELTQINYQENETSDEALPEDKVGPPQG